MTFMSTMARQKKLMTITLSPKLAERFEKWLGEYEFPPARTAVIELALTEFLDRRERDKRKEGK